MADNGSQPGTSAGSGNNINNTVSGNETGCLTLNLKGSSYQQAEKIINVHAETMKNVTFTVNNSSANTSTANIDYCPAPVSTFLGRYEELGTLKTLFTRHQVVALLGMGGLGKTQLSRKYVQVNKADYKYKYWLEAETPEKLENSFKELANILDIKSGDIKKVVNDFYKKIGAVSTILIFDNVEKPADVYAYLPTRVDLAPGVTIHVLVTSRCTEWTCDEQIQCYKLQPFNISASLQIFQRKFGETCIETMQKEWEELASMLGYLPLALQVATSYIHKRYKHNSDLRTVLADYMKQLREGADGLLNDPLTEYGNHSVYTSMLLTLKQLENKTDDKWKFAVTVMNAAAYMNPDWIVKERLSKLLDNNDSICILDEALVILTDYSIFNQGVGRGRDPIYSVHRIIQTSIRHNQAVLGTADMYYTRLLKYAFAEDYFARDVLQYVNVRAPAVADYYKSNPSPTILEYLVKNEGITAMEAALKLCTSQIQIEMKEQELLYLAVNSEDVGMVELLCKYGAEINQLSREGRESPLHLALKIGKIEIATWMLKNGAAPTQRGWSGRNALHVAIMYANHKMVPNIIKTDTAVVNETDNDGRAPLLSIDYSDNEGDILSTINVLVESGADTTAIDKRGNTVLHSAAKAARVGAVSLILQLNEGLIDIKNKDGETVLHVLGNGFNFKFKNLPDTRNQLFARMNETARVLIMNGLSINTRDNKGFRTLDTVNPEFQKILLQVAVECNYPLLVRAVKRQRTE